MGGNSRLGTKRIAQDRAHGKLGNPPIQYQSPGMVHLIHTWYCALVVPGTE